MILKKHENCEKCRFQGVKWTKKWFFECKHFFNIWHVKKFLIQNLKRCIFLSIQTETRCKTFKSKSDALYFFLIWHVVIFFIQSLLFKSTYQILVELLSKCCQHQRTTCWIMTTAWGKKIFYELVACACLTFGTTFLVIAFFLAIRILMGVMTISFELLFGLYKSLCNSVNG